MLHDTLNRHKIAADLAALHEAINAIIRDSNDARGVRIAGARAKFFIACLRQVPDAELAAYAVRRRADFAASPTTDPLLAWERSDLLAWIDDELARRTAPETQRADQKTRIGNRPFPRF